MWLVHITIDIEPMETGLETGRGIHTFLCDVLCCAAFCKCELNPRFG